MNALYRRFESIVKGIISGFDRIVFKGAIRPFMYPEGAGSFLSAKRVLNKDFKSWMQDNTKRIVADSEALNLAAHDTGILPFGQADKDKAIRRKHEELNHSDGLIGVWWAMESCSTYKARFAKGQTKPELKWERTKCKHLYTYMNHLDYGLMHVRLQTWFPYCIQVAMNGREWLARTMAREGIGFERHRNKFIDINCYSKAQAALTAQVESDWPNLLNSFLPTVFPSMGEILMPHLSYYWTLWQSEWATDYIFESSETLAPLADQLLRHAMVTGTGERVLRYMDRPFTKAGEIYANNRDQVKTMMLPFQDGTRVRHWVNSNSAKAYTEINNLRLETTINKPSIFKGFRLKENAPEGAAKERLPLRKGIADIPLRMAASQQVNDRLADHLATCTLEDAFEDTVATITCRRKRQGRKVRALDPLGKDRELLLAIGDPAFAVTGTTNKQLRQKLEKTIKSLGDEQAGAKASRLLRLLRDHGLIAKYPRQRRYRITLKGINISTSLAALLKTSTQQLMENAA